MDATFYRHNFIGLSAFTSIAMFRRGLFYTFMSIYLRYYLNLSVTETTLYATLPMLANVLTQTFIWGTLSDRFQLRRSFIIFGETAAGFGTLLIWLFHRLPDSHHHAGYAIIIGFTIVEAFWSMSNIGWTALISDIYPEKQRSAIQGKFTSVGALSRIIGVQIGGLLYNGLGHRYDGWGFFEGALFFVASAAMFISVIPMLFICEGGIHLHASAPRHTESTRAESVGTLYILFIVAMFLINTGRNATAVIKSQYLVLEQGFHCSMLHLSTIMNIESVAMIIGGLCAGLLARRIGDSATLAGATLLSLVGLLLFSYGTHISLIYTASIFNGLSEVLVTTSAYTIVSILIPPSRRANLFAIYNATFFLSWGIGGTILCGPVTDLLISHGSTPLDAYRASFFASAMVGISGFLLLTYLILYRMPRHTTPPA